MRIEFLDNLPQDKLVHGFIGLVFFTVSLCIHISFGIEPVIAVVASFFLSLVLGVLIEIIQWMTGWGVPEVLDAVAVWAGATFPALCVWVAIWSS